MYERGRGSLTPPSLNAHPHVPYPMFRKLGQDVEIRGTLPHALLSAAPPHIPHLSRQNVHGRHQLTNDSDTRLPPISAPLSLTKVH